MIVNCDNYWRLSQEIESRRPTFIWNRNMNSVPFRVDQSYGVRIVCNPRYELYAFSLQLLERTISATYNLISRNFFASFLNSEYSRARASNLLNHFVETCLFSLVYPSQLSCNFGQIFKTHERLRLWISTSILVRSWNANLENATSVSSHMNFQFSFLFLFLANSAIRNSTVRILRCFREYTLAIYLFKLISHC